MNDSDYQTRLLHLETERRMTDSIENIKARDKAEILKSKEESFGRITYE